MSFLSQKILVTGGTGLIGLNLVQGLLEKGATDIRATYHKRLPIFTGTRVQNMQSDLTDRKDCEKAAKGVDYVFMCAATTSGAAAIAKDPMQHVTSNILMNAQMLEEAYKAGVKKFIFVSSSVVYSPSGATPVKEDEFMLEDPYESYYQSGWMKRYTEVLCKTYSEKLPRPMPCLVLRPSNIYGPHDKFDFETSHATAALIRRVVERQDPFIVWGTGDDVRDLIYIDDFVEAAILAAEKINGFDPVNVGSGTAYSVKEVLHLLLKIDGFDNARVIFDASKPTTIPIRLLNVEKAKLKLGFVAKTDVKEGLRKTLSWYKENQIAAG